jgi:putative transposase
MTRRRYEISDENWQRIQHLLPGKASDPGRTAQDNRLFINAVLWIARSGAAWRDLPERYGNWNSVYRRFDRWSRKGVWQAVFEALQDPDLEWLMIDSTTVRAHQHAAGQKKAAPTPKR